MTTCLRSERVSEHRYRFQTSAASPWLRFQPKSAVEVSPPSCPARWQSCPLRLPRDLSVMLLAAGGEAARRRWPAGAHERLHGPTRAVPYLLLVDTRPG